MKFEDLCFAEKPPLMDRWMGGWMGQWLGPGQTLNIE